MNQQSQGNQVIPKIFQVNIQCIFLVGISTFSDFSNENKKSEIIEITTDQSKTSSMFKDISIKIKLNY